MRWRKHKQDLDLDLFIVWINGEKVTDKYLTGKEVVTLMTGLAIQGLQEDDDVVLEKVLNG